LTKIWKYKLTVNKFLFFFPCPPAHVLLLVIDTNWFSVSFSEFISLHSFSIFSLLAYLLFLSTLIGKSFRLIPPVFLLIRCCFFSLLRLLKFKHLWVRRPHNLILGIKWKLFFILVHYYNVILILKCVFCLFITKWLFYLSAQKKF